MIGNFDMVDFRLFVNIAETNSLRGGAELSNLSAPAASARLKTLEASTGTELLRRTSKGVTLTPSGQAFLHHARLVLAQLDSLGRDLEECVPSLGGYLRLAASPVVVEEHLPRILRAYLAEHANVRLDLRELLSGDIIRAVSSGTADLGIISKHVRPEALELLDFGQVRLALVTSTQHPLADRPRVAFAETIQYDFVDFPDFSPTYAFTHPKTTSGTSPISVRVVVRNVFACCRMVAANIGIAIVPQPSAQHHARNMPLRVIPLSDPDAVLKLQFCARSFSSLPALAHDLIDLLRADEAS